LAQAISKTAPMAAHNTNSAGFTLSTRDCVQRTRYQASVRIRIHHACVLRDIPAVEDVQFRLSLARADAWPQSSDNGDVARAEADLIASEYAEGSQVCGEQVEMRRWLIETWWEHADDGVRLGIERKRTTDNFWIPAEAPLPKAVTQQHYGLDALAILFGQKIAAEQGMHAERLEEIGGDARGWQLFRLIDARQIEGFVAEASELRKGLGFGAQLIPAGERKRAAAGGSLEIGVIEEQQTIGFGVGQRAQKHCIHNGEDRGVGSDPRASVRIAIAENPKSLARMRRGIAGHD
jgi:hypothetical protein